MLTKIKINDRVLVYALFVVVAVLSMATIIGNKDAARAARQAAEAAEASQLIEDCFFRQDTQCAKALAERERVEQEAFAAMRADLESHRRREAASDSCLVEVMAGTPHGRFAAELLTAFNACADIRSGHTPPPPGTNVSP